MSACYYYLECKYFISPISVDSFMSALLSGEYKQFDYHFVSVNTDGYHFSAVNAVWQVLQMLYHSRVFQYNTIFYIIHNVIIIQADCTIAIYLRLQLN